MSHTADADDTDIVEPAKLHGGYAKGHRNLVTHVCPSMPLGRAWSSLLACVVGRSRSARAYRNSYTTRR